MVIGVLFSGWELRRRRAEGRLRDSRALHWDLASLHVVVPPRVVFLGPGLVPLAHRLCDAQFDEREGNCWDNAPTESLWGSRKVGRWHRKPFATHREAMGEVIGRLP